MEKWKKCYLIILGIIISILFIATIVFRHNIGCFSKTTIVIIQIIIQILGLLIYVAMLIYFVINGILVVKRGIHNIKKCDDELFRNIDEYKKCWGEDKNYYIKQIQIINLYYKEGGKVDELVKNREIKRLYERAEFLLIQNALFDNMITYVYSLIISVIASFLFQMMKYESALLMLVWMITILLSFFGIIFLRYAEKGQAGSFRHYIDEYERSLLLQKINDLEQALIIDADDEQILKTKQVVINELIRIRQKKISRKQKQKLELDIQRVGQLDLCIGDYSECYIQKIYINGIECCLVYDREKGKTNCYIGELNLINQAYSILYQIMDKYELISYYENKNENKK